MSATTLRALTHPALKLGAQLLLLLETHNNVREAPGLRDGGRGPAAA
eukprot:CAMPEP_0203844026 /NCGR_PEP_ID=MMETSP0359-20131031/2941_1 /ASSEMBLY_ACC=CAM_ASM_000338 /TAXON_ID=268821 /ORGANISM="Scrippsiella Hangoei, Strain SHTV-5" /LENGTH=46 /DNA_ID= /DNA_START= /DNA_END= /DNA_ORIENTATION=